MRGTDDDPTRLRTLVTAAQQGDQDAFEALVATYRPRILRFLVQHTADPLLAEDLTQETFLAAFRSLGQLRDGAAFRAWLYTIARRQLARARRHGAFRRLLSLDQPMISAAWVQLPRALADTEHLRERVQAALASLPAPWRTVLLLHEVEGLTTVETATVEGITPAAARQRLSRAHRAFRMRYAALEQEDRDAPG